METLENKQYEDKISVIMGVYNQWDKEVLYDAISSILNQTMGDFEFIIYNDGSDEIAATHIRDAAKLDERIVLIDANENYGLAFSLNKCIEKAKGKYIARMDADDISMPARLMEQYRFLEEHPEYDWCGTNAELFDEKGVWGHRKMSERPDEKDFLKYSPYIHPSVMYRANLFENEDKYLVSKETLRCEDYEIFMRLHNRGHRGYNIQKPLIRYREEQQSYNKRKMKYRVNEARIRFRNFRKMKILFPTGWIYVIRPLIGGLVPNGIISFLKRKESGDKHGKRTKNKSLHK